MSFLAPLALLLGLLAIPIVVMYMLRLRRRRVIVSSTLLWQKLVRDRQANAPWQRLRRNLLLLLQLLILAAIVFALARPFVQTPAVVTGNTVVVLDASASMQATDGTPTRFDAAKAELNRLIGNLSGGDRMTIIRAGRLASVLAPATADRAQLRAAVAAATADTAPADWAGALALASGAAQGYDDARVVIVSDGGLPEDLPPLPVEAVFRPVGESAENVAISALATRPTADGVELFAAVTNEGTTQATPLLSLEVDGQLYDARRLAVGAGGEATASWRLPEAAEVVEASLAGIPDDQLPLDDQAWVVVSGQAERKALLVTEGNLFLEQALRVLPNLDVFQTTPNAVPADAVYDLYIYDGVPLPQPLPDGNLVVVNPPAGTANDLFSVGDAFATTLLVRQEESPLLAFVTWRDVSVQEARTVTAPWAQAVVEAEGGPLLLAGETEGRRVVILPFDLRASDLPLRVAFPVLMANIVNWLSPGSPFYEADQPRPGTPVTITPGVSATTVIVEKPSGDVWRAAAREETIFEETETPGVYRVYVEENGNRTAVGSFAVNLFAPEESAIRPAGEIRIGQDTVGGATQQEAGRREFWYWFVLAGLVILALEWWVYHHGLRLPRVKTS